MKNDALRLAVDIGGTFTDTVLMAGEDHILASTKILTTHLNPANGALEGVARVMAASGRRLEEVTGFIHGTTLATNALIERRGARVATVTTEGFRDILEIAYERRYAQYDIDLEKPDLLVPRDRAFTVRERMSAQGEVLIPLDDDIEGLVRALDAAKVDAVAICLLHTYANDHQAQLFQSLCPCRGAGRMGLCPAKDRRRNAQYPEPEQRFDCVTGNGARGGSGSGVSDPTDCRHQWSAGPFCQILP